MKSLLITILMTSAIATSATAQSNAARDNGFPRSEAVEHRKVAFDFRHDVTLASSAAVDFPGSQPSGDQRELIDICGLDGMTVDVESVDKGTPALIFSILHDPSFVAAKDYNDHMATEDRSGTRAQLGRLRWQDTEGRKLVLGSVTLELKGNAVSLRF